MKNAIVSKQFAVALAAASLAAASPAIAQDDTADIADDAQSQAATEQAQPVQTPATPEGSNAGADIEEIEFISIDKTTEEELPDDLDEFADEIVIGPSPKESNLEELRRSFDLYKEALAIGSYDEADTLAKRMVELAIRVYGLDSHESAKALTNLGLVQQKSNDYESAVLNFEAAIDIVERIEDRLNSDLISPLRGLGSAQLGAGRPDLARRSYARAVHISHVNEGPHNLMQVEVLEELAEVYLSMGDRDEALDVHQSIYNLEARNTDMGSEAIIPTLERQAEWLNRMRLHEKERMTYRRIIRILEDSRGRDDLSLIKPLTGLGESYMYVSEFDSEYYGENSMSSGDTYLKRAMHIAEDNPDADWRKQQETMLSLADFYVLTTRAAKAKRIYQNTWKLLSEDDERIAARAEALEKPKVLIPVNPPKYFDSARPDDGSTPPDSFETGTIVVGYEISNRGGANKLEIVDADPPGLEDMEYAVAKEVKRIVHRPRMMDGTTVDTPGQTYIHEFYYRPSDLPVVDGDAVAAGDAGTNEGS